MIHSRGALLSKATCGAFAADKSLVDEIGKHEFRSIHELIAYIREWEETNPELKGIRFADDKLIFDGFGQAQDAETVQTYTKLAAAMNKMDIEARCTNAISRTGSDSVTGLFCRLNGTTMNIYLSLSDEAIIEIAQDPNAVANLSAVRQNLLIQACNRNSMLVQGSYNTVKYNLVDKYRNEIASYTIHRTECR